jgi:hypothetical protein
MAFDPFHSARLIYRAIEDDADDDAFLHLIQLDAESLSLGTTHILTPQGKKNTKKLAGVLRDNTLLAVMICLTPSASSSESATPIGFIALSKSHPDGVHSA